MKSDKLRPRDLRMAKGLGLGGRGEIGLIRRVKRWKSGLCWASQVRD
jgi:hypothetical protein